MNLRTTVFTIFSLLSFSISATELENSLSIEVNSEVKLRIYVDQQDQDRAPKSLTAYSEGGPVGCMLNYLPVSETVDRSQFVLIGSEPKYSGRVDIYTPAQPKDLKIKSVEVEVKEEARACEIPSHPELCDENPPMVKRKAVFLELVDSSKDRWMLHCYSQQVLSESGITPSVSKSDVMKSLKGLEVK